MPDQAVEIAGADVVALGDAGIQLLQHAAGDVAAAFRAGQDHDVAVRVRLDAEPILDQRQMRVVLAEQPRQEPVVLEGHDHPLLGRRLDFLGRASPPAGAGPRYAVKSASPATVELL